MRRGRRGKAPGRFPGQRRAKRTPTPQAPTDAAKPSGDDRRAASPLPATRQARHAHGGLSRPFGRWTGADEEARLDNAPSACQSPAFPACPPPQPPLPPRAPPSPLHSRAWSHAPSALRRESPSGTTLRAVGIRNCDDGRRGGRGGFCRRALRGHCRVVAQRCRRWGASATPARAAVGVWYRGSFLPARQRSLQSRPASREGDNSSPFAHAPVGNYRPRSRRSAASRYDKKARPSMAAPPAPLCSFASRQTSPLGRCFLCRVLEERRQLPVCHAACDRRRHVFPARLDEIGVALV